MLLILPALALLPLVAFYISLSSSDGGGGPFSIGSLTAWSSWMEQISSPSHSHQPVTSPSVMLIASPDQVGESLPPTVVVEYTTTSSILPLTTSVSPRQGDDKMLFLQPSTFQLQLLRASELLLEIVEVNSGTFGSLPPPPPPLPLSPSPAAQLLIGPPPNHITSPRDSSTNTPASLTEVGPTTPLRVSDTMRNDPVHQSSKQVKPPASTRMSRSEYMQLKGCFFDDPRACPRTNTLDGFLDVFFEFGTITVVFMVVMFCAVRVSAIAKNRSESIGDTIIQHTLAVSTGCSASQQVLDASEPQHDHVSFPPRHLDALSGVDGPSQTDDAPTPGTFTETIITNRAYSPVVSDVSPVALDASAPFPEEALNATFPHVANENLDMDMELLRPPAIQIDHADSLSDTSADDLSVALHNLLQDYRRLKEDIGEVSITPPSASPVSTAPPSPILSDPSSLTFPDWTENQILNPEYLRQHNLGPDGLPPSLSKRSFLEELQQLVKGDCDGMPALTSTRPGSCWVRSRGFGEDGLSRFTFDFTVQIDCQSEDFEASSSKGDSANSSSFSFVFLPPAKRFKREHEDEEDVNCSWASPTGSGRDVEDEYDCSMDLTTVLDDVVINPHTTAPETATSFDSEMVAIPEIRIIADSPPTTPRKLSASYSDLSGFDDEMPMSSTPVKSGTSLDTFRQLCLASIRGTGNTSRSLDTGSPDRPIALCRTRSMGRSTSSLDLARHLPPLTTSCNVSSRAGSVLNVSSSEQASDRSAIEPGTTTSGHHLRISSSSALSDDHSGHIPPTWSFDMEAYLPPPPVSMNDSFYIGSSQSSSSPSSSVASYKPPVLEAISDPVVLVAAEEHGVGTPTVSQSISDPSDLVAVEDRGAAAEDEPMDSDSSFHLADLTELDEEYLLDQTFGEELAGCDDLGFGPLDESETSRPQSPGTVEDENDEQCNPAHSSSQVALDSEAIQELSTEDAVEVEVEDSGCLENSMATCSDESPAKFNLDVSIPSSASIFAPVPRLEDLVPSLCKPFILPPMKWPPPFVLPPWTTDNISSTSSENPSDAEEEKPREFVPSARLPQVDAGPSTPRPNVTFGGTAAGKEETPGYKQWPRVFAQEDTPELSFATSSVASPASALPTPAPRAYARSYEAVGKALSPHRAVTTRSPLREYFIASDSSSRSPLSDVLTPKRDLNNVLQHSGIPRWKWKVLPRDQFNPYRIPRLTGLDHS
ncbi:hypothetical protein BD410DRAFT_900792 [Rickenella mellea]|uniref:Uncharacterized protein n=1 Tax=Rickenella mellea TaxID=50990 RepID=A0A4Y7PTI6_9AGAM|nr:hypothetical protein BD410DRAFT_900792 [Rickenella mellea]